MNFIAEIIAGVSLAEIELGSNIQDALSDASRTGVHVTVHDYSANPVPVILYRFAGGIVSATTDLDGVIFGLRCSKGYAGRLDGTFYPGMLMDEVLQSARELVLFSGSLLVNRVSGAGFFVPEEWDWVDGPSALPRELELQEMFVRDPSWYPYFSHA